MGNNGRTGLCDGTSSASTGSGCRYIGEFGKHEECLTTPCHRGRFTPNYQLFCKDLTDASQAPLCQLPAYIAHRNMLVRHAAKARFIELQRS